MSPREPLRFAPQFQASYFPIRLGLVPSAPTMFIPEYEESVPFLRTANGSLSAAGAGTGFWEPSCLCCFTFCPSGLDEHFIGRNCVV